MEIISTEFLSALWIGLTAGGLSCLAMQGGLLASVIANQKDQEREEALESGTAKEKKNLRFGSFDQLDWQPVLMFLTSKLVAHTLLGVLLGLIGSAVTLSLGVRLAFQTFTALFMFATAMNLLNVHPIFRFVTFQPPKFLQRVVRNTSKSKALFAPALLGALTIFVPCGVTQTMEVNAINSGNPVVGALIMFAFVLGTFPLFAMVGVATAKISEGWYATFTKIAAASLLAMALYGFNGVLVVLDAPLTLQKISAPFTYFFSEERFAGTGVSAGQNRGQNAGVAPLVNGVQQVTINIMNSGYSPNRVTVKAGTPVELTLISNETYTCALAFVFKEFGISTFLDATDTEVFSFTPTKPGRYQFACSMGMYTGVMEVI